MDFEVTIDSPFTGEFGTDGLGIYYLKDIERKDSKDMSYSLRKFNGLGVFFDTKFDNMDRYKEHNYIFGLVSDGNSFVSPRIHHQGKYMMKYRNQ